MLSVGGYVAQLRLDWDQCDLSEGLPRQNCCIQRIKAEHELHTVGHELWVVVMVVLSIELDRHQIGKLIDR